MEIAWHEPQVQSALIYAIGYIIAAVSAAACAAVIGRQFINRKKVADLLELAKADIQFLLECERLHCDRHKERDGESNKIRVRRQAKEIGKAWSGRFTTPD